MLEFWRCVWDPCACERAEEEGLQKLIISYVLIVKLSELLADGRCLGNDSESIVLYSIMIPI